MSGEKYVNSYGQEVPYNASEAMSGRIYRTHSLPRSDGAPEAPVYTGNSISFENNQSLEGNDAMGLLSICGIGVALYFFHKYLINQIHEILFILPIVFITVSFLTIVLKNFKLKKIFFFLGKVFCFLTCIVSILKFLEYII